MNKALQLPVGVKYIKVINWILFVLAILLALVVDFIAIPGIYLGAINAGKAPNLLALFIVACLPLVIGGTVAGALFLLNKYLSRLNPLARVMQIVFSIFLVCSFPVGTILYGIALYYLLFDKKTKEAFKEDLPSPGTTT